MVDSIGNEQKLRNKCQRQVMIKQETIDSPQRREIERHN